MRNAHSVFCLICMLGAPVLAETTKVPKETNSEMIFRQKMNVACGDGRNRAGDLEIFCKAVDDLSVSKCDALDDPRLKKACRTNVLLSNKVHVMGKRP